MHGAAIRCRSSRGALPNRLPIATPSSLPALNATTPPRPLTGLIPPSPACLPFISAVSRQVLREVLRATRAICATVDDTSPSGTQGLAEEFTSLVERERAMLDARMSFGAMRGIRTQLARRFSQLLQAPPSHRDSS